MSNAVFWYSNKRFPVNVTRFSYSWRLMNKGSSKARRRQTIYPFRMVQGDLTVDLIFSTPDEYRRFCDFARGYHLAVTSSSGWVGDSVPSMHFDSDVIPEQTAGGNGMADVGGIRYEVTMPTVSPSFANDMVAPTLSLTLGIIRGVMFSTVSGSMTYGNMTYSLAAESNASSKPSSNEVKDSSGLDDAFAKVKSMQQTALQRKYYQKVANITAATVNGLVKKDEFDNMLSNRGH